MGGAVSIMTNAVSSVATGVFNAVTDPIVNAVLPYVQAEVDEAIRAGEEEARAVREAEIKAREAEIKKRQKRENRKRAFVAVTHGKDQDLYTASGLVPQRQFLPKEEEEKVKQAIIAVQNDPTVKRWKEQAAYEQEARVTSPAERTDLDITGTPVPNMTSVFRRPSEVSIVYDMVTYDDAPTYNDILKRANDRNPAPNAYENLEDCYSVKPVITYWDTVSSVTIEYRHPPTAAELEKLRLF